MPVCGKKECESGYTNSPFSMYICASVLVSDISDPDRNELNRVMFRVIKTVDGMISRQINISVLLLGILFENTIKMNGVKNINKRINRAGSGGRKKFRYASNGNNISSEINIFSFISSTLLHHLSINPKI